MRSLKDAERLDPEDGPTKTLIAMLLERQGDDRSAIEKYREAVNADPSDTIAKNNLAFALAEQGEQLEEALKMATAAHDALPEDPTCTDTVGWVCLQMGQHDSAIQLSSALWSTKS